MEPEKKKPGINGWVAFGIIAIVLIGIGQCSPEVRNYDYDSHGDGSSSSAPVDSVTPARGYERTPAQNLAIIDGKRNEVAKYQTLLTKLSAKYKEPELKIADMAAATSKNTTMTCYEALQGLDAAQ